MFTDVSNTYVPISGERAASGHQGVWSTGGRKRQAPPPKRGRMGEHGLSPETLAAKRPGIVYVSPHAVTHHHGA
jgi:hypothetical protein